MEAIASTRDAGPSAVPFGSLDSSRGGPALALEGSVFRCTVSIASSVRLR
jgi:hypothetical protein